MEYLLNPRIKPADKRGRLSYLLKYKMIYRILIILYEYTYRIEKIDRYPALPCSGNLLFYFMGLPYSKILVTYLILILRQSWKF